MAPNSDIPTFGLEITADASVACTLSGQELIDTVSLSESTTPDSLQITPDEHFRIKWSDSSDLHHSSYNIFWLHQSGIKMTNSKLDHSYGDTLLWNQSIIAEACTEIKYQDFMETGEGLSAWLRSIRMYGLAIIKEAPTKPGELRNVVKRFAYIRPTIWGDIFDVVCKPIQNDPSHLAWTGMPDLHTDMNYREKSPGIQLLHCLENSCRGAGGASLFADGYYVSHWLKHQYAHHYNILRRVPVKFTIKSHNKYYTHECPVICETPNGEMEIHYNNRTVGTLEHHPEVIQHFYDAYRIFGQKLRTKETQWVFSLAPGDIVAFNNRRVLHGRTSFDAKNATRHLQGCYVHLDEVTKLYN